MEQCRNRCAHKEIIRNDVADNDVENKEIKKYMCTQRNKEIMCHNDVENIILSLSKNVFLVFFFSMVMKDLSIVKM